MPELFPVPEGVPLSNPERAAAQAAAFRLASAVEVPEAANVLSGAGAATCFM
ncbi:MULTISPECIES: hypothetical protein [Streptomyces]|uniref:hypothetical protein n=1 Tax=Streptomyces TaxID=1883 RepID=UPI003211D194